MTKRQKFFMMLCTVLMFTITAKAGQLTANIEPRQINFGDTARYDVVYEGDDAGAMQPDFSALQRDFQIFSTSSSMQSSYVNGVGQQKRTWTLLLRPKYEGKLHIPALKLDTYQTPPLEIEVLPADATLGGSTTANRQGSNNVAAQNTADNDAMTLNSLVSHNNGTQSTMPIQASAQNSSIAQSGSAASGQPARYWAELSVDNRKPYVRQEIIGTLVIYDRIGLEIQSDPRFIDAQDWEISLLGNPEVAEKNGERMIKVRYSMIPLKSGTLTVPKVEIDAAYLDTSKTSVTNSIDGLLKMFELNLVDLRHFGVQKPARLETKPIALSVKPIPDDYGNYFWLPATAVRLNAKWTDKTPVFKIGEAVTREISLTAAGVNEAQLPELTFAETPAWKQYPEKPQLNSTWHDNQSIAQSVTQVVYIPQKAGPQEIPEIKVRWYNVKTNHIENAIIPAEKFYVTGENVVENTSPTSSDEQKYQPQSYPEYDKAVNQGINDMTQKIKISALIALAFLAGGLLSFLLLRSRGGIDKSEKASSISIKDIENSLKKDDYRVLRDNLLKWGEQTFTYKNINNLNDLSELIGDEGFSEQMQKLTGILYAGKQETLDKKIVLDCLKRKYKKSKDKLQKPLPDLYK